LATTALAAAEPLEPCVLRVLSYNIRHAQGNDGVVDLQRIAQVIRQAQPDLVALQEVDRGVARSGQTDQPAELGRLTGLHALFEKNIDYGGGEYGNAILSRFPIVRYENFKLPALTPGEQRGALAALVEVAAGRQCWFVSTHWDSRRDEAERLASTERLAALWEQNWAPAPTLIAGDLNAVPDSEVLQRLRKEWVVPDGAPTPTYPAVQPARQIDYVLARPAMRWRFRASSVVAEAVASDHRPLLAELVLLPEAKPAE
jgi:endonuclease/exonuclease/phosphatase family metal-dependent hydrolase